MSDPSSPAVGVILVGGRSTRMGSDKAMLALPDGTRFLKATARTLAELCPELLLVGSMTAKASMTIPDSMIERVSFLEDAEGPPTHLLGEERTGSGPLGGVVAAMKAATGERLLVTSVDAPLVTQADFQELLDVAASSGKKAVAFAREGRLMPLPAFLDASLLETAAMRLMRGNLRLRSFIEKVDPELIEVDAARAERLRGVNTPEEYDRLLQSDGGAAGAP